MKRYSRVLTTEDIKDNVTDKLIRGSGVGDLLNDLSDENEQLKQDHNALIYLLENQSMIIQELHSKLLEHQVKEPIILTKKDLKLMDKVISYYTRKAIKYTHRRCGRMTENKRFRISQGYTDRFCHDWQNNQLLNFRETVELLNEFHEENNKIKSLLLKKVEELKNAYDKSARVGMPNGGIIGELDSFEEICRIMEWIE